MALTNYFGVAVPLSVAPKSILTAGADANPLTGSSAAEKLVGGGLGHLLSGLGGDDTYVVSSLNDLVVEQAGGGIDTVQVSGLSYYALTANVENLTLYGKANGMGNDLANVIKGSASDQTIEGGKGDDVLTGNGGTDVFVFHAGSGHDVITDFTSEDRLRIGGYGLTNYAQIQANLFQDGADTVLRLSGGDAIRLSNVNVADLKADNFQLNIDTSQMKMSFDDEFNQLSLYDASTKTGTWLSSTRWVSGQQGYVDPNDPLTKSVGVNPYSVDNGILTITASLATDAQKAALGNYDYLSGKLTTQNTFSQQYGYFEMRAETPQGQGAWPAFWLLPADGNPNPLDRELDVMEQVANGYSHQAAHYAVNSTKTATSSNTFMADLTGYHTYGMLWTATEIAWYIDGEEVFSMATPADLNRPMYLIANLAMGGDWPGNPDKSLGDQSMNIDYIRAYTVGAGATSADINIGAQTVVQPVFTQTGTSGADKLIGSNGNDHLVGLAGDDTLVASTGNDVLDGGLGSDTVTYAGVAGSIQIDLSLTGAQDTHTGGLDTLISIENVIGTDFDDTLTGNAGANLLNGGAGNDKLDGGAGDDVLIGGAGNDVLIGGAGNDSLSGGVGDDVLNGGAGNDIMDGSAGTDTVTYATATAGVTVDLSLTTAQNTGGAGIDTLAKIENLTGSAFADTLTGNGGINVIAGGDGNDVISAGSGNDTLVGGSGVDTLTGGAGNDTFVFNLVSDSSNTAPDIITDFKHAADLIDLSHIDANSSAAGNQAFSFIGGATFGHHAGELRVATASDGVHVYGDVNGDGLADFQLVLTGNVKTLLASDFIL